MPRPDQYSRIAERYQQAADLVTPTIREAGGFAIYHSFESIGCAWIRYRARQVPESHRAKINTFVSLSRGQTFGWAVSRIAILTNAIRNRMLYPSQDGAGGYYLPEDLITDRDAADLLRRVQGVVRSVSENIS